MTHMKKKGNKKNLFFKSLYFWCGLGGILVAVLIYIGIYAAFRGNGLFSTGIDLEKSDWLAFLGSYLSFAGTAVVSGIAIFQTYHYEKLSNQRTNQKRAKEIQPIFSIKIDSMDTMPFGSCEAFNLYDSNTLPKHKNITLQIENVSPYPIKHMIVFDKYIVQLLKSNEVHSLQGAYEDSPDYDSKNIIKVLQSEYERSSEGLPKWFNINYEDVDGNDMFQSFELKSFDGQNYYAGVEISEG